MSLLCIIEHRVRRKKRQHPRGKMVLENKRLVIKVADRNKKWTLNDRL